jgi:transmembrane sensor
VSRLELPVKDHLRDPVDEAALQRIWMQIDGRYPERRRHRRRVALGVFALAGAAVVALTFGLRRDAGPLRFGDGRALFAVDAPEGGARLSLSDGSSIELSGGARFEPLESSGAMFLAVLQRGTAAFEVRPGGPRRWQVECGLATVEVVGTRFSCERAPGHLRVAVQRGSVIVRGERVADRARRLVAGESLDVGEAPTAVEADATPELPALDEALADEAAAPAAPSTPPPSTSPTVPVSASWRELARRGRHGEAFAALGEGGVRRETQRLSVADLLALADVARLSGHPREAVAPLERILSRFARDPQAPLAAFALGRLELDALDQPRKAAAALERALALGVPRSLKEDVRARLVEAYGRAGDRTAAHAAARAYLREFPDGRERAEMETQAASD